MADLRAEELATYGDTRERLRAGLRQRRIAEFIDNEERDGAEADRAEADRRRSSSSAFNELKGVACGASVRKLAREYSTRASTLPLSFPFPCRPNRSWNR